MKTMLRRGSSVLFDSDSESDTDSIEEVHVTKYFQRGLLQGIQQARAAQSAHIGIKRQRGHYHLRDCKHAVLEHKIDAYNGKHYDVAVSQNLQRATHRLTKHFIDNEISKEQARRVYFQVKFQKDAEQILSSLNQEFWSSLDYSCERENAERNNAHGKQELVKDNLQVEMMRRHNCKLMNNEAENERKRQLALYKTMKSGAQKTASVEDFMDSLTETNQKRLVFQTDLLEAFSKYEEEEEDIDHEYQTAMFEVMDEALTALVFMLVRQEHRDMEEEERIRRIEEMGDAINDEGLQIALGTFDGVMGDLQTAFIRVQRQEEDTELEYRRAAEDIKESVLYELRKNFAKRYVDRVCAIEKFRRIKEAEELLYRQADPEVEKMKKALVRIQRQMILQKFGGKWINLQHEPQFDESDWQSDKDKKLRGIRMAARRDSCVVRGPL